MGTFLVVAEQFPCTPGRLHSDHIVKVKDPETSRSRFTSSSEKYIFRAIPIVENERRIVRFDFIGYWKQLRDVKFSAQIDENKLLKGLIVPSALFK